MKLIDLRKAYHKQICSEVIRIRKKKTKSYPNFADGSSRTSKDISWGITKKLEYKENYENLDGQTAGTLFENITLSYLKRAFEKLRHLRPGIWKYEVNSAISLYDQYKHLEHLEKVIQSDKTLASTLGSNYIVKPDIVVSRKPVKDSEINAEEELIKEDDKIGSLTPLRNKNNKDVGILHASVSCKYTIRSDRSQNTRTEALNLIRNRKGKLPNIAAVIAEPMPTRIAALALGTGDLDCVYHFALYELQEVLESLDNEDQLDMLNMMVDSRRLRDISDLPFDLAI